MVFGETETLLRAAGGGLMVNPNVSVTPEYDAVSVTNVADAIVAALAVKVAEVDPCGIVTEEGMIAPAGDELNVTVEPPLGAALVSAIVQVDVVGGAIEMGLQENPFKLGCRMVTVPPFVVRASEAAVVSAATPSIR